MADVISRLKIESGEFDSKIKRASDQLTKPIDDLIKKELK